MKRYWMVALLGIVLVLMTACGSPPTCPCDQVAIPAQEGWECVPVDLFQEPVPKEAYEVCKDSGEEAAGIWAAEVCEPDNGFSPDGWLTLDTGDDTAALLVGPSADGPWTAVEVNGPQWALSMETLQALAAAQGVDSYENLWFKAGEGGTPARLGSMITDRAAHMDDLCGAE